MRFDRRSASYFLLGDCCPMMEDNSAHFFEGTEKLLEVWFSRQDDTKGTGDLRTIPRLVPLPSPFAFPSPGVASGGRLPPHPRPQRESCRAACLAPLRHFIQHTSTRVNATNCVEPFCRPTKVSPDFSDWMALL